MHVLAVQHTPAEHDEIPVQRTSQLAPSQRTFPGQELTPVHVTVLMPPCAVTPPGQADAPVQLMSQSPALHVTPVMHELVPHVTVQLEPPHVTAPQLVAAEQSTVHELAEAQSTSAPLAAVAVTEHGMPEGQVQGLDEHVIEHVPATQVPPLQSAGEQPASLNGASRSTSDTASLEESAMASLEKSGPTSAPSRPASARPPDDPPPGPPASVSGSVVPSPDASSGGEVGKPSTEASAVPLRSSPPPPTPHADANPMTRAPTPAAPDLTVTRQRP
jgi:hypothetical protein